MKAAKAAIPTPTNPYVPCADYGVHVPCADCGKDLHVPKTRGEIYCAKCGAARFLGTPRVSQS